MNDFVITNIKSKKQHDMVEKKLFNLGYSWELGRKIVYGSNWYDHIAVDNKDMYSYHKMGLSGILCYKKDIKQITAKKFLGNINKEIDFYITHLCLK